MWGVAGEEPLTPPPAQQGATLAAWHEMREEGDKEEYDIA